MVAPPSDADGWARYGSTAGLRPGDLERLVREAVPQPVRSLTRPLRLSGAVHALPSTGVLCTHNGGSIELLRHLVRLGGPDVRTLTEARVTFFELDTGHWPMLSEPAGLAGVLLRAAAGEGHRLEPAGDEPPPHLRPFLLDAPEPPLPQERTDRLALHLPTADDPRPAVVFVHGGPLPAETQPSPLDWLAFQGYGQYVARLGAVAAVVHHGLHGLDAYGTAADDVAAAVERVRADPRVDGDRVALWFFSGGGLLAADWLTAAAPCRGCAASPRRTRSSRRCRTGASRMPGSGPPTRCGRRRGAAPPVVLTRVEREMPEIAATVAEFLAAAGRAAPGWRWSTCRAGTTGSRRSTTRMPRVGPCTARSAASCGTSNGTGTRPGRRAVGPLRLVTAGPAWPLGALPTAVAEDVAMAVAVAMAEAVASSAGAADSQEIHRNG